MTTRSSSRRLLALPQDPTRLENDRARDALLATAATACCASPTRRLEDDPDSVVATIRTLLADRRAA
jgi:hypothetical protein